MPFDQLRRREFITLLGGAAAAWPLAARAQQPAIPVIGFLDLRSAEYVAERLRAFHQGLKETGYIEGENVAIVYRFAENQNNRLPELVADLVRRQVAVIATAGDDVPSVVKAAGRETRGFAGRTVGQVRTRHQRLDRPNARPDRARQAARCRRRR